MRLLALLFAFAVPARAGEPRLADLKIPGTAAFAVVARDVMAVRVELDPSVASGNGLFDDSARVPSFSPEAAARLVARLDADLAALKKLPWRSWDIDRQVDWRWVYANAEDVRRQLAVEKLFLRRPSAWLEPLANNLIALATYAPERADVRAEITASIPGMVAEMRRVAVAPTARDAAIADGVAQGVLTMLRGEPAGPARDEALKTLSAYLDELKALKGLRDYAVVGAENYAWRLKNVLLLPWQPRQLVALALKELTEVDAALAALPPKTAGAPSPASAAIAKDLDQAKLLGLYDAIVVEDMKFLESGSILSIPAGVGPIRTRPTPEAMIPLTGDGGSMNPPPTFGASNVGWWNVEHFKPEWTEAKRLEMVTAAVEHKTTDMGPYAVHEGVPGHHLQLSIARLNPNPLRNVLWDNGLVEGWALYAEDIFWRAGGLGPSKEAERQTLESWRFRVRRVFYDVNVESGDWSLQNGADFKDLARRGQGQVVEDILRTINWPAQLIGYFTGKMQLVELREEYKKKVGAAYSDRAFHDAVLAEGSIPVALIRAKLLGEPVPSID
ncbi:MAG: DUF885 family protein [Elusimicrobia bacterium]|nr:DUF885 family protein [Elusimicrobiota bacterium]